MEYCLGDADGSATMWTADPNIDVDGDGALDAVGLDFDGDGLVDDAVADTDGDGLADQMVRADQDLPVGVRHCCRSRGGEVLGDPAQRPCARHHGFAGIERISRKTLEVGASARLL